MFNLFLLFLILLFWLIIFILAIQALWAVFKTKIPYGATPFKIVKLLLDEINLPAEALLYDLGCGDGRVLKLATQRGYQAIGYELRWWQYLKAKILNFNNKKAKIFLKDFWNVDLSDADVVFCYLFPNLLERLKAKFLKELNKDTWVCSFAFPIEGWSPYKILSYKMKKKSRKVYVYKIKKIF